MKKFKNICITTIQALLLLLTSIFTLSFCLIIVLIGVPWLHINVCTILIKNRSKNPAFTVKEAINQSNITINWLGSSINFKNGD